ncbi:MAG: recombinase RecD [Desulfobacteraceae bacterium 4572_89]|nr:MAG: recombinase RecD [Desulfobacteraceae bacterium 4572_89]
MITIKGVLTRLTFQNPENHYTVCKVKVEKINDPIVVVGHLAGVGEGESLTLIGQWASHPKYGDQFKAETYRVTLPATISGIRKYLGSGMIRGVSKSLANRIVDTFKEQTLEIIENEPEKLLKVNGIGRAKKDLIEKAWNSLHSVRRVMQFLQDNQVGVSHVGSILKTYGSNALNVLQTDPYLVAKDIPGIGFNAMDTIARAAGIEKEDEKRLQACLICQLLQYAQDGHVYAEKQDLFIASSRLSGVDKDLFEDPLKTLSDSKDLVVCPDEEDDRERLWDQDTPSDTDALSDKDFLPDQDLMEKENNTKVYLAHLFKAESGIASRIKALLSMPVSDYRVSEDQIMEEVLTSLAVKLSQEQVDVVSKVLHQKIVVITGGPGTGKTTLVRALCAVFKKLRLKVTLSAPTGRAARRLSEVTGKKAFTLHKLLGFDHESRSFERGFANPLDLDVFVVDEASMVDTLLMYHLVEAMPAMACLILVGDTFQLPSVGPGNVLSDIIESEQVRVFSLTKIFRQARESPIVMHAHSIRNGIMPDFKEAAPRDPSEFYFIENQHPQKVVETILELCSKRIPAAFPHIDEVQVLTPMHRGDAGTINLNLQLQAVLNDSQGGIESHGLTFKPRDKVMHLKNNYEKDVFNGDIGVVHEVNKAEGKVLVDYDGRIVSYDLMELDELTLAYTISVHKSQGSEYAAVIIALTTAHFPLLQRNLLYTAMTRGKHLVIIVGASRALEIAFQNNKTALRLSGLKEKLISGSRY